MKKPISLLLALALVLALASCGEKPTAAAETQAPSQAGRVSYLHDQEESQALWLSLAEAYTSQTGVEVHVAAVPAGSYAHTLTDALTGSQAPTLFRCGTSRDLLRWEKYCLDLSDSQAAEALTTDAFNLYDSQGALKALGYSYHAVGILVNVPLLEQAGYFLTDITDFSSLQAIAQDIHSRASRLGFDAFCSAGLRELSSRQFSGYLANAALYYEWVQQGYTAPPQQITGETLHLMRNLWDLYLFQGSADPQALAGFRQEDSMTQLIQGQAVFCQGGSWDYETLAQQGMEVAMIPLYCGAVGESQASLSLGTEDHWAVNAQASQADIQATLDFLNWVVTSEEGISVLQSQWEAVPFQNAGPSDNPFLQKAQEDLAQGKYPVTWDAMLATPNPDSWRATVVTALRAYCADPTDAAWSQVAAAMTEGWAYELAISSG